MMPTALDRMPMPPSAALLGWRLVAYDPERRWLRVGFDGKRDFLNPAGSIQGGIQAAMLDDTMGPALWLATDGALYSVTIEMSLHFLNAAKPGPLFGEAVVAQIGSSIAFLEAKLLDAEDKLLARAAASARLMRAERVLPGGRTLPRPANDLAAAGG